jgi:hypothetical protein
MHEDNGDVLLALQRTEVAEQRGDLSRVVLVDAVQPCKGVEEEEARRVAADCVAKARLIAPAITIRGDHSERRAHERDHQTPSS